MVRVDTPLAACAIAFACLAWASGAVAAADVGDSAAASTNSSDANSDADHTDANTYSGGGDARTTGDQSGDVGQTYTGGAEESGDEQGDEKKPVDDDSAKDNDSGKENKDNDDNDKSINRIPLLPEAPPPIDLAPLPEELPPPPLEPAPPPVDLPPAIPAAPVEPDPVDVMTVGSGAALPDRHAPTTVTFPVIVAPAPVPLRPILGASLAPREISGSPAITSPSRWGGEPVPTLRRAATGEPPLRESPPPTVGLTAGKTFNRAGYNNVDLRSVRLAELAAGALPGVAGLVMWTASGVCLGYRQAVAGQQLRPQSADRFLP